LKLTSVLGLNIAGGLFHHVQELTRRCARLPLEAERTECPTNAFGGGAGASGEVRISHTSPSESAKI
jgi:hypothetical protein